MQVDRDWLLAAQTALGPDCIALVQGYPYSGFAGLQNGDLTFPLPEIAWNSSTFWDIRIFSSAGEWHAWSAGSLGWRQRIYTPDTYLELKSFIRTYPIWGNQIHQQDGWTHYTETRGAEVWVPRTFTSYLQLQIKLFVDFDKVSHLAGVVDTVICRIEEVPQ